MKQFFKLLRKYLPFKKQIYTLIKVFFRPPRKIYQHLYFNGLISVKVDTKTFFKLYHYGFQVENEIFWEGLFNGWERDSLKIWNLFAKDAKVICDVGANTGVYALLAKSVNPQARVIAFEPVQRVYEKLLYNIELNSYNIETTTYALSNYNGKASIHDTRSEHTYSVTVNKKLQDDSVSTLTTEIDVIRFDTYCEQNHIKKVDLIKIDVETHEPEVIEGYGTLLHQHRPIVLIEILNGDIGSRVMKQFSTLNYAYYSIQENGIIEKTNILTRKKYWNYPLLPCELCSDFENDIKPFDIKVVTA